MLRVLKGSQQFIKEVVVMHVLTGWNHELFNWAKPQIFQGFCKEHVHLARGKDFCLATAVATTPV